MDPLSATKLMASAQYTAGLNNPLQDVQVARQLSTSELEGLEAGSAAVPAGATQPTYSFQNLLTDFVGEVSQKQTAASDAITGLLGGKDVSLHQAVISMEEASVSFDMMVQVRNKLLDSYQELMRMQV